MTSIEPTITCTCGHTAHFMEFRATPISGELPTGTFQCPKCHRAVRREPNPSRKPFDPFIILKPVTPVL